MSNDSVAQWRPIASAPHDENILVFSSRWGAMIATFRSEFNAWFSRMQCPVSLNDEESEAITHWMPLPPTPEPRHTPAARPAATGLPPSLARFIGRASTRQTA